MIAAGVLHKGWHNNLDAASLSRKEERRRESVKKGKFIIMSSSRFGWHSNLDAASLSREERGEDSGESR